MKKIVNKFLIAGHKFMPENAVKLGFMYNDFEPFIISN